MATEVKRVYSLEIQGTDSVDNLKKSIEQLNDKLKQLNSTSEEYRDTLAEITDYQNKLKDAMDGLKGTVSDTDSVVEDFVQGFIDGMQEAAESSNILDESVLGEATSVKELKEQIKILQDALVSLDSESEDYARTVKLLTERNQKLQEVLGETKKQVNGVEGSYNALSQELSALKRAWRATNDEQERAKLGEKISEVNGKLKELDASIGNYQRNVGNYANSMTSVFGNPRKEIAELRKQLAGLTVGSKEYNAVLVKMADLTQQQRHFTEQLKFSSSNLEDILTNMAGVARGVAGGFSVMNAAMGLFGDENDDVQKAMLKTQQMIMLMQGLSGLEGLKDRFTGLWDGIKGFVERLGILNKDMGTFNDTATQAGGAAATATDAMNAQGGATATLTEQTRQLTEAEKEYVSSLEAQLAVRENGLRILEEEGLANSEYAESFREEIKSLKQKIELTKKGTSASNANKSATEQLTASEKQLNAETAKGNKLFGIDVALKKLDTRQTAQLAAGHTVAALAIKGVSLALKGLKYALISTGIGAIIVALGELIALLGKGISRLWNWIKGTEKHKEAIAELNKEVDLTIDNLDLMLKYYKAIGATSFKQAIKEFNGLTEAIDKARKAYEYAKEKFDEDSDEAEDALGKLNELMERQKNLVTDNIIDIQKMLQGIKETEEQRGMTDLEKDLAAVNQQFDDAIAFLEQLKKEIPATAIVADNLLKKLNDNRELALKQATENNKKKGGGGADKDKQEAERLYKQLVENSLKEEERLRLKYEKEYKLLVKYHKDTKLLTEKYNKDMQELLDKRHKFEQDKWFAHLDSMLRLETTETEAYLQKNIDNLEEKFGMVFGSLEKYGEGAFTVTKEIAEQMRMMGLDPENIQDVQTMTDKWIEDKKAIEDAKKELIKFRSEQKMLKAETSATELEKGLQQTLDGIELFYSEMESQSVNGWLSGLWPKDAENMLNERYDAMQLEAQKEVDLWKKLAEDESLTLEDRKKAQENYKDAVLKQTQLVANRQIETNNLVIKSYQNVANAMSRIANSLVSILGTVSDAIMDNAQAQLDAGKITEKEYEQQFNKSKGFQIAEATINTIAGAVGAFMGITKDTGGWGIAAAAIEAAAVMATGIAEIAKIKNTTYSPSGSGGGGGGATAMNLPSVMISEPEYQQTLTNQSDTDTLANAIGDAIGGQRVYVVESDIQNANNKSNKRKAEVTF